MTYDLKSINLPRLGPGGIRALNVLAGSALVGNALVGKLRKDAGLGTLTEKPLDDAQATQALPPKPPQLPAKSDKPSDKKPGE